GDPPHPAGVVQVDVRDGDVREVGGADPEPFQPRDHGLEGGARSGFDDRGLVGVEEIGGGGAFATAVERVDRGDPSRDLEHDRLHAASLRGVSSGDAAGTREGGGWRGTVNAGVPAGPGAADPVERRMPSGDEVTELRLSVPEAGK